MTRPQEAESFELLPEIDTGQLESIEVGEQPHARIFMPMRGEITPSPKRISDRSSTSLVARFPSPTWSGLATVIWADCVPRLPARAANRKAGAPEPGPNERWRWDSVFVSTGRYPNWSTRAPAGEKLRNQ